MRHDPARCGSFVCAMVIGAIIMRARAPPLFFMMRVPVSEADLLHQ
jgi:hypothetical protein